MAAGYWGGGAQLRNQGKQYRTGRQAATHSANGKQPWHYMSVKGLALYYIKYQAEISFTSQREMRQPELQKHEQKNPETIL